MWVEGVVLSRWGSVCECCVCMPACPSSIVHAHNMSCGLESSVAECHLWVALSRTEGRQRLTWTQLRPLEARRVTTPSVP